MNPPTFGVMEGNLKYLNIAIWYRRVSVFCVALRFSTSARMMSEKVQAHSQQASLSRCRPARAQHPTVRAG